MSRALGEAGGKSVQAMQMREGVDSPPPLPRCQTPFGRAAVSQRLVRRSTRTTPCARMC